MNLRIGIGLDVHALEEGRPLILGGVKVPFHKGLQGYSDADVLLHALIDALLGAAALGDIGKHFPDSDPLYKDISSLLLLKEVSLLLQREGFVVNNLDSIIVAQQPRLSPYLDTMCGNIASTLELEKNLVSVKATTTELLGFTGRGEGIVAYAVAMLRQKGSS